MNTIALALLALFSDRGQISRHEFAVGGEQRTALVYVPPPAASAAGRPASSAPTAVRPMVFVFHGHGGTARHAARKFAIHREWPQAVVAYMQGLPTEGINGRGPGWQKRGGEDGDRDLNFFDAVLRWAVAEQGVDARRVYVGGHSNGAMMAYVLWVERHDALAAVAPASGVFGRASLAAKPLPALIIAGRGDRIVPFKAQEWGIENARSINRCGRKSAQEWEKLGTRFESGEGGATLITYVHDQAHQLPADAGKLMVRFFREVDEGRLTRR